MVHTSLNCLNDEGLGLILSHAFAIVGLEHGHSGKRAGTHCDERSSLKVTVIRYFNQLGSLDIDTSDDAVSANMTAILEDMAAQSTDCHLHTALRASVEAMQL